MEEKKGFCSENLSSHFVLNSLGTVRYLLDENPKEAGDLLDCFISYTKMTLRWEKEEGWNSISRELKYLKAYEEIMNARFGENFSVIYDLQAPDFLVPYFSCKRLVETAFYQGVRDLGNQGKIEVKTYTQNDNCVLEITQNGAPFVLEENNILKQIKSAVTNTEVVSTTAEIIIEKNRVLIINQSL